MQHPKVVLSMLVTRCRVCFVLSNYTMAMLFNFFYILFCRILYSPFAFASSSAYADLDRHAYTCAYTLLHLILWLVIMKFLFLFGALSYLFIFFYLLNLQLPARSHFSPFWNSSRNLFQYKRFHVKVCSLYALDSIT